MSNSRLRLGTRSSALARWQANWVANALTSRGIEIELVPITTRGDQHGHQRVETLGSPGVFTKEIQKALQAGNIDLAVHSLKDLPTDAVEGLCLAAVPARESPHDVLVARNGLRFDELPEGASIGTSSLRRRSQLWHARTDLQMRDVRGNVDTRLRKLAEGQFDALVLAEAGLKRLGLADQISEVFAAKRMLPAVGQGALGLETRCDDRAALAAVAVLDDSPTHQAVAAERTLLARLGGGCLAPLGAWARVESDGQLRLDVAVLSADGRQRLSDWGLAALDQAVQLGADVAARLLAAGAGELIGASRSGDR